MKNRSGFFVVAFVLTLTMLFMAAGSVMAADKIKLIYGSQNPKTGNFGQASIQWMDRITKASNGEITFQGYWGQSLFKGTDSWEAVKQGQTDIGFICVGFFPGVASLSEWAMLPFIPYTTGEAAGKVAWRMYEKYPEIAKQYEDDFKVLNFAILQPYFWQMKDRAIHTIDDVKGSKVRVASPVQADTIRVLGGNPVFMGINEVYPNMEKRVVDGCINPWEANNAFKLFELANQYTMMNMGSNIFVFAMNKKKWNSLSPEHQKIIMSESGEKASSLFSKAVCDDLVAAAKKQAETKGPNPEWFTPNAAELKKWEDAVTPQVWGKWVKDNEAKGFKNAKQILDDAIHMIKTVK